MTQITYDLSEVVALLGELKNVQADLRTNANRELRQAAGECARAGIPVLRASAAGSPTPQASLVASTAKVKNDRVPAIQIGGSQRVGHRGTPASELVWGSERGGRNFKAGAGGQYWIDPAVKRLEAGPAPGIYMQAVYRIFKEHGIV